MVFAINGPCVGGIFGITMANADIIVAVEDAYFGGAAIRNAIGGGSAPTDQLPWRIAMEMTLRGKSLSAQDAYRVGFVNHLVSHEELMPFSTSIAEEIAANPPLHVQASKQMTIVGRDIPPSVAALPRMLMSAFLQTTPDAAEGPKAFIEKRKAQYTGEVD
jgi:E-phenylitaconyl-CoA hydratase